MLSIECSEDCTLSEPSFLTALRLPKICKIKGLKLKTYFYIKSARQFILFKINNINTLRYIYMIMIR